jgi:signal peptidase I
MPPRPAPEDDDDLDEDEADDEPTPPPPRSRAFPPTRARSAAGARLPPVRRWSPSEEPEPAEDDELEVDRPRARRKPPVYWRARDSLYFEPLVAVAILAVLLVSLFAYTSNWPPVYVIESNSMQHGPGDHVGYLNAGDIVLAQKAGSGSIETYVQGLRNGFRTYGEYGDVLLYQPDGSSSATPIIHRAIIYLQYNPRLLTYNATGLVPSECTVNGGSLYVANTTSGDCGTTNLPETTTLVLYGVGGRTVAVYLGNPQLGTRSGYVTLGDNNSHIDQISGPDHLSNLVEPGWVIGVARGMIPWFGAFKLLLDGHSGYVPTASWEYLGLTIAGVILAAAGLHLLLRRRRELRGERDDRSEEVEEEEAPEAGEPPPRPHRAPTPVRPWSAARAAPPDDEEEVTPSPRARRLSYEQRRRTHFVSPREASHDRHRRAARKRPPADDDDDV